jgi:hypothetical protein
MRAISGNITSEPAALRRRRNLAWTCGNTGIMREQQTWFPREQKKFFGLGPHWEDGAAPTLGRADRSKKPSAARQPSLLLWGEQT